ncbi:putative transcriptional acitvator, Baf family [Caldicellulosiruptor acetigenus I77R1B]|uniref:Type III pantothenate kinase n=2 Tax=Caldicellulosiruptor acetigenus TaxID=301953 RepID=G2PU31_9FIRM|nr:type III pantothenate kinase [Caldicellulosiruptor acetigenus]ADQ40099.1 putative transcriptional acitvator, Baf family [Caldicellulosiruptor acetigenus I77R1B]AEM74382.1 putative transcriptional acitvator, Baf family [Caldicellulosiruptor acetigenus 6A]
MKDKLLVVDIGNTNIVFGVYKGKDLMASYRMKTDKEKAADEFGILMTQMLSYSGINPAEIMDVIISSVVPPIMYSFERAIQKYFGINPMVVGPGIKTGLNIKTENPKEVGSDRIVNAVAVNELYGGPAVIIDFGTATTFCALSRKSEYLGGAIAPGIKISAEALFSHASRLHRIELQKPPSVIGKNTVHAMQSGILYGYVGLVDYMVNRIKEEMDEANAKVIATGGLARLIAEESKTIQIVNPTLTLEGLRIIYYKNKQMSV